MNTTKPLVSICCITYNHENFIRNTIEGFLMQKLSFPIEIIIHDDASTDKTAQIIKEYADRNPDSIVSIFQTTNQYSQGIKPWPNFVFPRARGKYIALCEGDDYWTDPHKLQKQVDLLEGNQEYVLCFHDRLILGFDNVISNDSRLNYKKSVYSPTEVISLHVPTLTVVFRNVMSLMPPKLTKYSIDASLFLFLSQFGSFYFMNFTGAVFRQHQGGVWSGSNKLINYNRSITARLKSWRYLTKIDKVRLSGFLFDLLLARLSLELKSKLYGRSISTFFLLIFHDIYSGKFKLINLMQKKLNPWTLFTKKSSNKNKK